MKELRFDDRVAIVTGAGRGIGRAHALELASRGARVVVADLGGEVDGSGSSHGPADDVVGEIRATGGEAVACYGSVAIEADATAIVDTALDTFGRLDVVVNNAGIHDPAPFESLSVEQFRRMFDVHFFGTMMVTHAAWPRFLAAGYGRVVNTTSEAILGGIPQLTSYGAAKGAVFGLTRNLATEGAAHGIRVNALAPRAHTRMSESDAERLRSLFGMDDDTIRQVQASMPPEHNAPAAAFLAHESCPLNGELLRVGMASVARLAMVHTVGITKDPITAEDIAEHLDAILDVTDAHVTNVDAMEH
jgi:NAD(P)-dependent dehydrogenase (short-subunit alcohol dehydrogenase family)